MDSGKQNGNYYNYSVWLRCRSFLSRQLRRMIRQYVIVEAGFGLLGCKGASSRVG